MSNGVRHSIQRSNRVRLKADAVVLLDRIASLAQLPPRLANEVAEMRLRFAPAPGTKAPIVYTGYTK